ncbi:MAG: winged helix-turn-helix domain-containing protein [Saprospiraceae bacterium]
MKENLETEIIKGEGWTFNTQVGTLSNDTSELILEPRLARLFHNLLLMQGEIAKKEKLFTQVWPDTMVNEESLHRAISDLRRKLAEWPGSVFSIETIPRVGYRLLQPAPKAQPFLTKLLKAGLYLFLAILALVILIRAAQY